MRVGRVLLLAILGVSFMVVGTASAQVTGTPPFSSSAGGPDVIDLANLNAHLTIPVLHKLGRGINFTYDLTYDSSVWYPVTSGTTTNWQAVTKWGWLAQSEALTGSVPIRNTTASCFVTDPSSGLRTKQSYPTTTYVGYKDPSGTLHTATIITTAGDPNCDSGPVAAVYTGSQQAIDGSGYLLTVNELSNPLIVVTRPSGANIANPGSSTATVTDTNGNQLTTVVAGSTTTFTDTLGTTALTVSGSGTPSSPITYTYTAPSGAAASYTTKYSAYTVQTKFGCNSIAEYGPTSNNLVSEIDLPDGSKYSFAYEGTPGVSGKTVLTLSHRWDHNCENSNNGRHQPHNAPPIRGLSLLNLYFAWIVGNDLRGSAIIRDLARNAHAFVLVIDLGPAELGPIAAPNQNGEHLVRVRFVEV